jgi:hypothetical protein
MRYERLRTFCQTLRFRLTLWNTAVVLVLLLMSLAAIREGLRLTLSQMVDEFIKEELYSAVLDVKRKCCRSCWKNAARCASWSISC